MRVKCLAQEHNTMTRPGLELRPLDQESSALTIRPPLPPSNLEEHTLFIFQVLYFSVLYCFYLFIYLFIYLPFFLLVDLVSLFHLTYIQLFHFLELSSCRFLDVGNGNPHKAPVVTGSGSTRGLPAVFELDANEEFSSDGVTE